PLSQLGTASLPSGAISWQPSAAGSAPVPRPPTSQPTSLTTTLAPSRASASAMPRPIPRPEPVTTATLPSRSFAMAMAVTRSDSGCQRSRRRFRRVRRSGRETAMPLLLGEIVRRQARHRPERTAHVISLDRDAPALLARASDAEPEPDPALSEHDPHVMLYTSGTTGDPKGALLSHRTYVLQAMQTQAASGLGEDDVGLCMFPMFHMGGWAMPLGYWTNGGTVVLMEKAEPGEILRAVARERVTYLYLIPTLY